MPGCPSTAIPVVASAVGLNAPNFLVEWTIVRVTDHLFARSTAAVEAVPDVLRNRHASVSGSQKVARLTEVLLEAMVLEESALIMV